MRAARKIVTEKIPPEDITEELFNSHIDLADAQEIDLVIRTGNKKRLSGLFPWQSIYAELFFTDTFWPVFGKQEFIQAIEWFGEQKRTRGK